VWGALRVHRGMDAQSNAVWSQDYSVTVANVVTGRARVYIGGPGHNWVNQFVVDISQGAFGGLLSGRYACGGDNCTSNHRSGTGTSFV
jgi:hypothetical protein